MHPQRSSTSLRPLRTALAVACMGWLVHVGFVQATPGTGGGEIVPTHPLNDTGITWSGHATSGNASTCDASHPAGQDCHYGRDAAAAEGQLTKKGHSGPDVNPADPLYGKPNGFDFTKISNSGNALPYDADLGSGPNDWACTKDNVTGLIWEVKVNDGSHLRHMTHTYTWFNTHSPDGSPGTAGTDSGHYAACKTAGRCDTEKYVQDVNSVGLCGATDWRMPTVVELTSILDLGRNVPFIDETYFPHTPGMTYYFWSASPQARNQQHAWMVSFAYGTVGNFSRGSNHFVRLVRAGQ